MTNYFILSTCLNTYQFKSLDKLECLPKQQARIFF